jgi:ferredoxin
MSIIFSRGKQQWDAEICMQGLNVLGHAQMIELFIGSECGGHGKCGKDRVYIDPQDQSLVNPPTALERAHLSAEQISSGMRLACQCFPSKDGISLRVSLPDLKGASTPQQ